MIDEDIDRPENSFDMDNKGELIKTEHLQHMHMNDKIRYPCDQCDYTSTQKGKIKMHIDTIHNGKNFPCEYVDCMYTALRKDGLKNHIMKVHGHEKVALLMRDER